MSDQRIPRFISNQPQFESDGIAAVLQLESGCGMAMLVAMIMAMSVAAYYPAFVIGSLV